MNPTWIYGLSLALLEMLAVNLYNRETISANCSDDFKLLDSAALTLEYSSVFDFVWSYGSAKRFLLSSYYNINNYISVLKINTLLYIHSINSGRNFERAHPQSCCNAGPTKLCTAHSPNLFTTSAVAVVWILVRKRHKSPGENHWPLQQSHD